MAKKLEYTICPLGYKLSASFLEDFGGKQSVRDETICFLTEKQAKFLSAKTDFIELLKQIQNLEIQYNDYKIQEFIDYFE